jgi:hypothetical protein
MADLTWESFDQFLPDGDIINVTIEEGVVSKDIVEFCLEAASHVDWWKEIRVPDGLGASFPIYTQDSRTSDSVALWADQVKNGQKLHFSKAKFLGWHTGVYDLGGLDRLNPGSRVTFQWAQDEDFYWDADLKRREISLTHYDPSAGIFRAYPGEQFTATYEFINVPDKDYSWSNARRIMLRSERPSDNTTWGLSRVPLPKEVEPYHSATFTFASRAPEQPGTYLFSWRMYQAGGHGPFGSMNWATIVVPSPPQQPPPPPPPLAESGELPVKLDRVKASLSFYGESAEPLAIGKSSVSNSSSAKIINVTNTGSDTIHLTHIDKMRGRSPIVRLRPGDVEIAAFQGLRVAGRWVAQYRGAASSAPQLLTISVLWTS